jgi:predicted site-specific integrase-resolvase
MTDAVIYNRVSTSDQDVAHQLPACEELCRRRGWTHQVVHETGKRTRARDGWREVLDLVRRRRVRVVVVWAADRIGGLWSIADTVRELDRLGVAVVSASRKTWLELGGRPDDPRSPGADLRLARRLGAEAACPRAPEGRPRDRPPQRAS